MLKLERLTASVLAAAAAVVAGCTSPVGPQSSGVDVTPRWQTLAPAQAHADLIVSNDDARVDQQWWSHFNDRALEALVHEAIADNKSLAIARARVEEARAARLQAQSALAWPRTGARPNWRERSTVSAMWACWTCLWPNVIFSMRSRDKPHRMRACGRTSCESSLLRVGVGRLK
nr:hypothetical protein [Cupriavidus oxalaticus]